MDNPIAHRSGSRHGPRLSTGPNVLKETTDMTEEQIKLLEKALALYQFTIEQRREDNYDVYESNDFYGMVSALENMTGLKLDY